MGAHAHVHLGTLDHFAPPASLHALLVITSTVVPAAVVSECGMCVRARVFLCVHMCVCLCVCCACMFAHVHVYLVTVCDSLSHQLSIIIACITANVVCTAVLNSTNGDRGAYSWPDAAVGQTISQMCQYGVVGQNITRLCNGDLTWTEDASQCPTVVTNQFKQLIQNVVGI